MSECHNDRKANLAPRELTEFHVSRHPEHGPLLTWCDRCHDPENYDRLHLLDGTPITFDEGFRLCGQCHGERMRDWSIGLHGAQRGAWSGPKTRLSCPACHNPHDPRQVPIEAMPAPKRPNYGPGGTSHEL